MRKLGIFSFTMGMLIAAIAAAKVPESLGAYPNTLPSFFLGFVICLIGLLIWYKAIKNDDHQSSKTQTHEAPSSLLNKITQKLAALEGDSKSAPFATICQAIDEIHAKLIWAFVEQKHQVLKIYGLEHGSELIIQSATGERLLNRAWSAAADKHRGETCKSVLQARHAFEFASSLAEKK